MALSAVPATAGQAPSVVDTVPARRESWSAVVAAPVERAAASTARSKVPSWLAVSAAGPRARATRVPARRPAGLDWAPRPGAPARPLHDDRVDRRSALPGLPCRGTRPA